MNEKYVTDGMNITPEWQGDRSAEPVLLCPILQLAHWIPAVGLESPVCQKKRCAMWNQYADGFIGRCGLIAPIADKGQP